MAIKVSLRVECPICSNSQARAKLSIGSHIGIWKYTRMRFVSCLYVGYNAVINSLSQETIFVADGGHDYRIECNKSGEPLIQTMVPTTDAHESALDEPFVESLVGPPYSRTAYEVSTNLFSLRSKHANSTA
jgi:hypothetical protein